MPGSAERVVGCMDHRAGRRGDLKTGSTGGTGFNTPEAVNTGTARSLAQSVAPAAIGRTHQIRVHLAADGHPVLGDPLYGKPEGRPMPAEFPLALRSVSLAYRNPFTGRPIRIQAPTSPFLQAFGFKAKGQQ